MIEEQTNSRPSRKGGNATPIPSEISSAAFEGMIANQKLKLQNESTQLAIREKEIHYNVELAKKSMDMDLELEKKMPGETRKNLMTVGGIVLAIMSLSFLFFGYCMHLGKEHFVIDCIKYALYLASAGGGFYIGQKVRKQKSGMSLKDAQVIDGN